MFLKSNTPLNSESNIKCPLRLQHVHVNTQRTEEPGSPNWRSITLTTTTALLPSSRISQTLTCWSVYVCSRTVFFVRTLKCGDGGQGGETSPGRCRGQWWKTVQRWLSRKILLIVWRLHVFTKLSSNYRQFSFKRNSLQMIIILSILVEKCIELYKSWW